MPGFYSTHMFPRLMDWAMGTRRFREQRQQALAPLYGSVLEIGFGTGLNLPHYPQRVTWLTAVDPAQLLPRRVTQRSVEAPMPLELVHVSAECLPFEEARFDCALSTWTLCTIPDAIRALREVRRVLKPKGLLVFLEHGLGVDPKVATWQTRLNPIQRVLACGCNINRPIDALIQEAGLEITRLERFQMEGTPRIVSQMYRGTASAAKA